MAVPRGLKVIMTSSPWPPMLPVRHVRIARPTDQLDDVVRFYRDGLGLPEIGRFDAHAGYRGVMLGLPCREDPRRAYRAADRGAPAADRHRPARPG